MKELDALVLALHKIYPKEETINPFYKIELKEYPTEYQHYFKLLTHYFTILYKNNRAMEKEKYVTSREDIVASLNLLEIMTLKKHRTHQQTAQEISEVLRKNTKENQILSAKNISDIIGYKKSQTHQIIHSLLKMNQLEKVGGHKNIGFLYQLK